MGARPDAAVVLSPGGVGSSGFSERVAWDAMAKHLVKRIAMGVTKGCDYNHIEAKMCRGLELRGPSAIS